MAKTLIAFDDQQIQKIEQIILDQDTQGAIRLLEDIRKEIKIRQVGCNPLEFNTREGVNQVIDKTKK